MVQLSVDIKTLLQWVYEAQSTSSDWRRQSWEDWEFRDGKQWTYADYQNLKNKGINPLTINRIFPILNLVYGNFIRNQRDIIAKGRTRFDTELAQVMSEALSYVRDQNRGKELITSCFNDEITAGLGYIEVGKHYDPRQESVRWVKKPWYSLWWDPYATPWLDRETCRYAFTSEWTDLDNLLVLFWDKKKEIMDKFGQLTSGYYVPDIYDPGTQLEEYKQYLSAGHWVDQSRKRVKPVEMWYTVLSQCMFAVMPDTRVIDLDTIKDPREQIAVVKASQELISATVKKMRVATFVSDMLLQDIACPYAHDNYPFVPFVGYLDRFNNPFGIPRQIKEQSMEVNKRRSMALALISNRRTFIEEEAVKDVNKAYREINRHNGLVVVKKGKLDKIKVEEMAELAVPQIDLMRQSEREIQEIAGATDEALQSTSYLQSAVGLAKKQEITGTVTSSLFENASYSLLRLGELTASMIQSEWTGPKILRVTDRLSGAEKFVAINEKIYDQTNDVIIVRNNITEGRFDYVLSNDPVSDTVREKNMELLFSAINKAPAEAVGPLLNLAFELSDLPEKDALLRQIRQATGLDTMDDNLSQEEKDAKYQQQQMQKQIMQAQELDLSTREREAKIQESIARAIEMRAKAAATTKEADAKDWELGFKLGQDILAAQTGGLNGKGKEKQSKKA